MSSSVESLLNDKGVAPATGPASCTEAPPAVARRLSPLLWILLAGAVVRLVLWSWFHDVPLHIWDERDYNILAINLVEYGEFAFTPGVPASLRPPLYPALLAGVYALFGLENFQAMRLLQVGLSLLTVVVLYRLGLELCSRRVALWLAGLYCFYPSMLGYNNLLLTETLFTLLLCTACYTLVLSYRREHLGYLAATGVLLGLAALTRSVVWLSPPLLAVFLLFTWRSNWQRRILAPVALLVPFVLTLAPWAIRNTTLERTFVAVDTMGGRNFMMGNYRFTPLYRSWDAIALTGEQAWDHEVRSSYPPVERETQGQVDKLALRQGLRFVQENPWLTLQRDVIKFFDFWGLERELVAGAGHGLFGDLPRPVILLLAVLVAGGLCRGVEDAQGRPAQGHAGGLVEMPVFPIPGVVLQPTRHFGEQRACVRRRRPVRQTEDARHA